jgi:hypothetical protein
MHTSYIDVDGQMLHEQTSPPEATVPETVLQRAQIEPEEAPFNPESLSLFAMGESRNQKQHDTMG